MGVLNCTPDSFYAASRYRDAEAVLAQAEAMWADGLRCFDLGGLSTRPGAEEVPAAEEWARIKPALQALRRAFPEAYLSVDTYRAEVLQAAFEHGADIANDISAGAFDPELLPTVAKLGMPYILMHAQGRPRTMQDNPQYPQGVVPEVFAFFQAKLAELQALGIWDVVLDLGFGFGKTLEQNYALMRQLALFTAQPWPVLVGVSRKSMIYKLLACSPEEALHGTTALHLHALSQGAKILRCHDSRPAADALKVWGALRG